MFTTTCYPLKKGDEGLLSSLHPDFVKSLEFVPLPSLRKKYRYREQGSRAREIRLRLAL